MPMQRVMAILVAGSMLLAGCVDQGGLPALDMTVDQPTAEWGDAVQVTIENTGQGHRPAPVTVQVVAQNGTVVRTFEDVTGGRGIPAGGQISVAWNGLNDDGRPVLWGNYVMRVEGAQARGEVQMLRPPNFAITIDPIPNETAAGEPITFRVNNTGNIWLNGSLTVAAGRQDDIFYNNTVDVELPPSGHYNMTWSGHKPNGDKPEPDKYLVAARMDLGDGPTPFAQDVFTLTESSGG